MPLLYNWWGYLFRWVGAFHIREADYFILHSDTGVDWSHSPSGSLSASVNGYRHCPSALRTCSFQSLLPHHLTCGLHPSSVDAAVDVHGISCNVPFLHPREALLVGHWVTTLPFFLLWHPLFITSDRGSLVWVGLVHLSCVWQLPIHKGMPIFDMMRRSQFWWRTHDHLCWFVTL